MWGKEFTYKEKNLHKENKWKHEQKDKIKISKKCQKMQFSRYANYYNEHQENNLKQYNMNV